MITHCFLLSVLLSGLTVWSTVWFGTINKTALLSFSHSLACGSNVPLMQLQADVVFLKAEGVTACAQCKEEQNAMTDVWLKTQRRCYIKYTKLAEMCSFWIVYHCCGYKVSRFLLRVWNRLRLLFLFSQPIAFSCRTCCPPVTYMLIWMSGLGICNLPHVWFHPVALRV